MHDCRLHLSPASAISLYLCVTGVKKGLFTIITDVWVLALKTKKANWPNDNNQMQITLNRRLPKITAVAATPVSVPTSRPCAWSRGSGFGFTRTVVELTTDDGLIGFGECEGSAAAVAIKEWLGKQLIGRSINDFAFVARTCQADFRDYGCLSDVTTVKAYAAIEMALWDLMGKHCELPVYQLLGGAVREAAEFSAYGYSIHLKTAGIQESEVPNAMAAHAVQSIKPSGARTYEFKIGRFSEQTDIETIRAVRHAVGDDVILAADANQALNIDQARKIFRNVKTSRLDWCEEPVAAFDDMVRLNHEFHVPLSTHCVDPEKLRFYPEIEGVVGDLHLQGGIRGILRAASGIATLGRRFWQRASLELGISWAAMVHVGISCPDINRASQSLIDYVEDDLIEGPKWQLTNGGVVPANRPGLGVELDRAALQKYSELFKEKGEWTYFDGE
jgi:glucarate dehydratase